MTSSHGRRIQSRRALAILAWVSLVVVAWLLWYGQYHRVIRIQAWEPAALLLSAYSAFLAIFGWLLFSPGRKSAEESPGLFFGGMLTLLPPCFIAYNLMPVGSPLKPWLTIGIFIFGIIAIMSPLPDEVFAVPRDRRTYLQPLTDAYLSELDVEEKAPQFDNLLPRTEFRLTQPSPVSPLEPGEARDPWADPFYGTGRQMSRIGVSQSRRAEESSRSERRRLQDPLVPTPLPPHVENTLRESQPAFSQLEPRPVARSAQDASIRTATPSVTETAAALSMASAPALSIPATHLTEQTRSAEFRSLEQSRPPEQNRRTSSTDSAIQSPPPVPQFSRRPLTEPSTRSATPVGFQTPPSAPKQIPSAPPLPIVPPLSDSSFADARTASLQPQGPSAHLSQPLAVRPVNERADAGPVSALPQSTQPSAALLPASALAASALTASAPAVPAIAVPLTIPTPTSQSLGIPLPGSLGTTGNLVPRKPEMSLHELDRQLKELESFADEDKSLNNTPIAFVQPQSPAMPTDVRSTTQQTNGDLRLERIRDEHGGEMIEGTIKVFFEVGQKRAHLHIPFSPPLEGLPEVECEPADDDQLRLKVAVRQPYGVRIEARRAEASEALRTEISFAAVYTPPIRRS